MLQRVAVLVVVSVESTGWRRSKRYLILHVTFHKLATNDTNDTALWRGINYKNKASCGSSPHYVRLLNLIDSKQKNVYYEYNEYIVE